MTWIHLKALLQILRTFITPFLKKLPLRQKLSGCWTAYMHMFKVKAALMHNTSADSWNQPTQPDLVWVICSSKQTRHQ